MNLPTVCYSVREFNNELIILKPYESGFYEISSEKRLDIEDSLPRQGMTSREVADFLNRGLGVSRQQEEAMNHGSMFNWESGLANPDNWQPDGTPIRALKRPRSFAQEIAR